MDQLTLFYKKYPYPILLEEDINNPRFVKP